MDWSWAERASERRYTGGVVMSPVVCGAVPARGGRAIVFSSSIKEPIGVRKEPARRPARGQMGGP